MSHPNTLTEMLVISAPKDKNGGEASIEQTPKTQSPTTSLFSEGVAINNTLGEKSPGNNDIVAPTGDPAPQEPGDNSVNAGLAEHPEEPVEAGELVEDTTSGRGERENTEDDV